GPTGRREEDWLAVERVRLEPPRERTDGEPLPRFGERTKEVRPAEVPSGTLVEAETLLERDDLLLRPRELFLDRVRARPAPVEVPGRGHERLGAGERPREPGADDHRFPDPDTGIRLTNFRSGAEEERRLRGGQSARVLLVEVRPHDAVEVGRFRRPAVRHVPDERLERALG